MMMTLRRLAQLKLLADAPTATSDDKLRHGVALAQRSRERGPSKLARRLRRKRELGHAGAF